MPQTWSTDQVAALAPDDSSLKSARKLGAPAPWSDTGSSERALWGACQGSGKTPYRAIVDLGGPAYKCSCPSRKFPCKHTLALLLLWAGGNVGSTTDEPADVTAWLTSRADRATTPAKATAKDPEKAAATAAKTAAKRRERVSAGLADLDRWLLDQVSAGLAGSDRDPYTRFDPVAARLVDAQAPAAAGIVRSLAGVVVRDGWQSRLLAEYALLHLLAVGHERLDELPEDLAASVREHVGYPTATDDVLARPAVRDEWTVLAVRDDERDKLAIRRVWLWGTRTRRPALVLSFGRSTAQLDSSLPPWSCLEADLHFYPGAHQRALVGERITGLTPCSRLRVGPERTIARVEDEYAAALARDPWLAEWVSVVYARPADGPDPAIIDDTGEAIAYMGAGHWQHLLATSGGEPVAIAGRITDEGRLFPLGVFGIDDVEPSTATTSGAREDR